MGTRERRGFSLRACTRQRPTGSGAGCGGSGAIGRPRRGLGACAGRSWQLIAVASAPLAVFAAQPPRAGAAKDGSIDIVTTGLPGGQAASTVASRSRFHRVIRALHA